MILHFETALVLALKISILSGFTWL